MSSKNGTLSVSPKAVFESPNAGNGVAISARDLSKAYVIARNGVQHTTAGEALVHKLKNPLQKTETDTFWALNGVDFDVYRGDVVGVIGRNGAGKSTLLKVLSRITEPTRGSATLHGRVGSLLEVGTGFHPELTGRENIFLNGAILGMSRAEITRQFDAIVDFSGTEKFLETPVKRYSSGMYVRLAFAVAAHLNPEILIVDEVLAVGDAEFQKKCLGKMQDVARDGGRTVLFVSHMMSSVLQLCNRAIYMRDGRVVADGGANEVIEEYIRSGQQSVSEVKWNETDAPGTEEVRLRAVRTRKTSGEVTGDFNLSDAVVMEMDFEVRKANMSLTPVFHVHNSHEICMFANGDPENPTWENKRYALGTYRVQCRIPAHLFNDGRYSITPIVVQDGAHIHFMEKQVVRFELHDDGSGRGNYTGPMLGLLRPKLDYHIEVVKS